MGRLHKPHLLLLLLIIPPLFFSWHDIFGELVDTVKINKNTAASAEDNERWGQSRPTAPATGNSTRSDTTHQCRGFYSKIQNDRSGSQICGMLWHSLYAYQMNSTYCGVCGLSRHSHEHQRLLNAMGLSGVLPLWGEDCPDDAEFLDAGDYAGNIKPSNHTLYSDVFADWRRKMTGIVQDHFMYGNGTSGGGDPGEGQPCKIVVHVRRGDIDRSTSFRDFEKSKYLPNSYFIQLIEQYRRPGCQVLVHTEEAYVMGGRKKVATAEGNNAFWARNYTVIVGGREEDAWKNFVDCDVFIASKSSFSYTPAIFSRGVVVFPGNYTTTMMPDWIVVPVMEKTCRASSCFERKYKALSLFNRPL